MSIHVIGDSIARGLKPEDPQVLGRPVILDSKGGLRFEMAIKKVDYILNEEEQPIVILCVGHCDFTYLKPTSGKPLMVTNKYCDPKQLASKLLSKAKEWKAHRPKSLIVWIAPLVPKMALYNQRAKDQSKSSFWKAQESKYEDLKCLMMKEWHSSKDITIFDLSRCIKTEMRRTRLRYDGVHFNNQAGSSIWKNLTSFLKNLLKKGDDQSKIKQDQKCEEKASAKDMYLKYIRKKSSQENAMKLKTIMRADMDREVRRAYHRQKARFQRQKCDQIAQGMMEAEFEEEEECPDSCDKDSGKVADASASPRSTTSTSASMSKGLRNIELDDYEIDKETEDFLLK